ncbi:MAG: glycosyltransferase family 2 protein [Bacteroidota bacterium]
MQPFTAIIITLNEAANIGRCLEALMPLADEVIVVDSFSEDDTVHIAKSLGATVHQRSFSGYADQKNHAQQLASNDWVLSIDADEVPDQTLQQALREFAPTEGQLGFYLHRRNQYCGKWIRYGDWRKDRQLRLYDRRQAGWKGDFVHERVSLPPDHPEPKTLPGFLRHYTVISRADHLARARKYALLAAEEKYTQGKKAPIWKAPLSAAWKFTSAYLFKGGFLDGRAGFQLAWISAKGAYWRYQALARKWKT